MLSQTNPDSQGPFTFLTFPAVSESEPFDLVFCNLCEGPPTLTTDAEAGDHSSAAISLCSPGGFSAPTPAPHTVKPALVSVKQGTHAETEVTLRTQQQSPAHPSPRAAASPPHPRRSRGPQPPPPSPEECRARPHGEGWGSEERGCAEPHAAAKARSRDFCKRSRDPSDHSPIGRW